MEWHEWPMNAHLFSIPGGERGVGIWCTVHNLSCRRVGEEFPDDGGLNFVYYQKGLFGAPFFPRSFGLRGRGRRGIGRA